MLSGLAKISEVTITRTLRISFDGLEEIAKNVFLHIACFFKGESKDRVLYILSSCFGFNLEYIINLLKEKSLVREKGKTLTMHDLIQEMGWDVVHQESPDNPGKRSLLWRSNDIYSVFKYNTVMFQLNVLRMHKGCG